VPFLTGKSWEKLKNGFAKTVGCQQKKDAQM
jgi:hypothetical protein